MLAAILRCSGGRKVSQIGALSEQDLFSSELFFRIDDVLERNRNVGSPLS